jgi:hypothetical protein
MSYRSIAQRLGMAVCALTVMTASPSLSAQISSSADYAMLSSDAFSTPSSLEYRAQYQNQYPNGGGYHQYKNTDSTFSHIAVQGGVGAAVPLGNTTDSNTTGYNFLLSGGYNVNKHFGVNLEYRFDHLGIQSSVLNALLAECNSEDQDACANGITGSTHAWSFTLDPVYNFKTSGHWGGYATGGGGFYRLLTSFNTPVPLGVECYYYCYEAYGNELVSHSSSNQAGLDVGGGVVWKPNPEQHGGIFADVRYEWLNSPGTSTSILPITFGFRW